jgi:release factor glutamine methyltransferase
LSDPGTIADRLEAGRRRLAEAGIEDARREARLILAHALGVEPVTIMGYPERIVEDVGGYDALISRRAAREPLSHLTGRREFWSLEFEVTPETLDPRPDSETLIEAVLGALPDRNAALSILDLGTGTGCLLLALLSELPNACGLGIDISEKTLAVARRNAQRLGLADRADFAVGDWGEALTGPFDLVVSNPPYIPSDDIGGLQAEVSQYEPRRALDGGADGLAAYRRLAVDFSRLLSPQGVAALEFGVGQGRAIAGLMTEQELVNPIFHKDLAGHDRCLTLLKQ